MVPDSSFYGVVPVTQPSGNAGAQPNPEGTTPVRTQPVSGKLPLLHQAGLWIVLLVAMAIGLVSFSVHFG